MEGSGDAGNDGVELEAMRKDTFSWHPCQVSLRSNGFGLIVQYKDGDFEEIIVQREGALARLRVRSSPLEGDDCASIQQGDHVLATRNSDAEGIFYNACIEEVIRVRHSKRSYCRCSFTIKWLDRVFKGEALTLPASAIMKLSRNSIKLHPTISAFFSMVDTSSGIDALPFSTTSDDMDCEIDINLMLERQIKDITHSNDVSAEVSRKIVIGLEGQSHGKATAAFFKDLCTMNPLVTNLKGSTGSNNVHSVVRVLEEPPAPVPPIQEEVTGIRSPLNPLSAWAALASMRSKFPQSVEHSFLSNNEFSCNTAATLEGKTPKFEGVVRTLFPYPNASQIAELPDEPIREHGKGLAKGNKDSGKKIIPCPETRATSSQTQRNNGMHEPSLMPDTNDKLSGSSKTRRVTRSTVNGAENKELGESKRATEENMSTKVTKLEYGAHLLTARSNCISNNNISVSSSVDSETNTSDKIAKTVSEKDGLTTNVASSEGIFVEEAKKLNSSRRVTRSAALDRAEKGTFVEEAKKLNSLRWVTRSSAQDCAEKNNFEPEPEPRKRKPCESNELKLDDYVIPSSVCLEVKRTRSSARVANIRADAKESESTPNTSESAMESRQARKKPSNSRMQATRSSPRLNFLPHTGSHA